MLLSCYNGGTQGIGLILYSENETGQDDVTSEALASIQGEKRNDGVRKERVENGISGTE